MIVCVIREFFDILLYSYRVFNSYVVKSKNIELEL